MNKDKKDSTGKLKSLIKYLALTGGREKVLSYINAALSSSSIFLPIFGYKVC